MEQSNNRLVSIWSIDSKEKYSSSKLETRDICDLKDLVSPDLEYQLSSSENLVSYELARKNLYETYTKVCSFDEMSSEFSHEKQQEVLHLCLRILNSVPRCASVSLRLRVPDKGPRKAYCWYLCVITEGKTHLSLLDQFFSEIPGLARHLYISNRSFVHKK